MGAPRKRPDGGEKTPSPEQDLNIPLDLSVGRQYIGWQLWQY